LVFETRSQHLRLLQPEAVAGAGGPPSETRRLRSGLAVADALAVRWSFAPGAVLRWLLAANVGLGAAGVSLGLMLRDDPALYFREMMPGTWLSGAQILAAAVIARAIHRREHGGGRRWHESLWGLSAVMLVAFAVVELTQPTVFLGKWLQSHADVRAPLGISDVDAVLLIALLAGAGAVLATRAGALLRHPRALPLFACAGALVAASQAIDATFAVSAWEFVVEDGLKALAEPFLIAGYLVVLGRVIASSRPG
jgi:hypothetical protein